MNVLNLDLTTLSESKEVAHSILNQSPHLANLDFRNTYNNRFEGFKDLIPSDTGMYSFTPSCDLDLSGKWSTLIQQDVDLWENKSKSLGLHDCNWWFNLHIEIEYLETQHILNNSYNKDVKTCIDSIRRDCKAFPNSPKLTKIINFMYGSASGGALDWLTTKAPTSNTVTEDIDYKVHVSTLPHHIAGMSYYGSANFGGDVWGGQGGTSCQDPKCGSWGNIASLPASLADQSLAIAWLSVKEDDDMWSPIYQARALVRIVPMKDFNLFLICKVYGTSRYTTSLLEGALQKEYGDKVMPASRCNPYGESGVYHNIILDIKDCAFKSQIAIECEYCESPLCESWCPHNNTELRHEKTGHDTLPYIDDSNAIDMFRDKVVYFIPKDELDKRGVTYSPVVTPEFESLSDDALLNQLN